METLKAYEFDPKILENSLKVMEVQDILLYSDNYNYESNSSTITKKLIDKEITPLDYSYCVYTIERYDSIRAKHYAKITSEIGRLLISQYNNQTMLQELKTEILERIFFTTNYPSTPHILLYFLEKNGFYEGKDFLDRIIKIKRKIPKIHFIIPFLVWFFPLFESYDQEFYLETLTQFQNYEQKEEECEENDEFFTFYVNDGQKRPKFKTDSNFNRDLIEKIDDINFTTKDILEQQFIDPIPYEMINKYEAWFFRPHILTQFKKNNWELHSFLCENGYFPGSIEEAIVNDDLEKFLEICQKKTISYETSINYNIFCHSHVIQSNANLIEFASIYSSVNIFNYLINTIESDRLHELTNDSVNVCFLATYGGCIEIIKICESFGIDITESLNCSACFYRHEILNWLIEYKNFDVNSYLNNYLCPLHQCASSNNLRGLFYLLWKGADINKNTNDFGSPIISPCTFGIEYGGYHTTSLLLSSKKLIIEESNIRSASNYSDFNIFSNVFNFFKKNEIEKNLFILIYGYSVDIKTSEFILEFKKNQNNPRFRPIDDFKNAIYNDNYLLASLIFKKFFDRFNDAIIYDGMYYALNVETIEAVKIFIDFDPFMNEKKYFYSLLLSAIKMKRLDVVKLLFLKLKVNEFDLSDLLDVFKISRISQLVNNSTTLFFKVFKYEEKEFFF